MPTKVATPAASRCPVHPVETYSDRAAPTTDPAWDPRGGRNRCNRRTVRWPSPGRSARHHTAHTRPEQDVIRPLQPTIRALECDQSIRVTACGTGPPIGVLLSLQEPSTQRMLRRPNFGEMAELAAHWGKGGDTARGPIGRPVHERQDVIDRVRDFTIAPITHGEEPPVLPGRFTPRGPRVPARLTRMPPFNR